MKSTIEWHDLRDGAPTEWGDYLVVITGRGEPFVTIAYKADGNRQCKFRQLLIQEQIMYWAELPGIPEEKRIQY